MSKPFKYFFVSAIIVFLILNFSMSLIFEKEKSTQKFYPSEYELIKRTFPYFDYDKNVYKEAVSDLKKMKQIKKTLPKVAGKITAPLEFVGPTNIGGRIVDVEFNLQNTNIIYAAAATGGVFKTIDKGENWFPIFDDQPCLSIGDIGIDPNNSDIIYVGTGEANGGHNNFPGLGIYKSVDAGENWKYIGLDSTISIGRIIVDPSNSQKIFVAAVGSYFTPNQQRGVYLSEDGGNTWQKSLFVSDSTGAIDLVMNSENPNILYAAMWERVRRPILRAETHLNGPTGGIYKTIDGGISWVKLGPDNGLPDPSIDQIGRIGLGISQSNPSIIYALYNDGTSPYGLYKSTDDGENWLLTSNSFPGSSDFSWYFGQIRVHPTNPDMIFVLDVSLIYSMDSGISWNFSNPLHVDHHALAFEPNNPSFLVLGNDGGINISALPPDLWLNVMNLPITQFYEIGLDETNPERFYGGTQDNNTIRTLSGSSDDWESIWGGDGFYVIVAPTDPNIIYAESQFGFLGKSNNGGSSFGIALNGIDSDEPTNWSTPVVMDPNDSQVLYYGTHSIYRTIDGANSWVKISPQLTNYSSLTRTGTITTIAVAPTNSEVIYTGSDDGLVWVSKDFGNSWQNITQNLPLRWVTRVVVDPKDENIVYVTFSGLRWADSEPKVFRSENMGETWIEISNGLPDAPINAFSIDNNKTDVLYLGNDIGAFVSYDKGSNWEVLSEDLPIVVVNDMKIHKKENYLAIGTHGRGIYKINLDEIVGIKNNSETPVGFELYQNYPNPFNPSTTIEYSIPSNLKSEKSNVASDFSLSAVTLKIYDILGREVATLVNQPQNPSNYKIQFDGGNFSSGIYFYKLTYGNFSQTRKMLLLK
jgi:photosystem II stability/assembly factor-like uncharacterized protein